MVAERQAPPTTDGKPGATVPYSAEELDRMQNLVRSAVGYNAERGECGPGDIETHVAKRIAYMREGSPYVFERIRNDGQVLEMRGRPIPGGGFVTTYADITHFKEAERLLNHKTGDVTQGYVQHEVEWLRGTMVRLERRILDLAGIG